jgi:hypothetical protein
MRYAEFAARVKQRQEGTDAPEEETPQENQDETGGDVPVW